MGCGGSSPSYEPEPEDEDVAEVEQRIEDATQYWEERIEPLRAELAKLKRTYEVTLADTTNKRSPPQLGGFGSASRKPVDDASNKVDETQKEIRRLQSCMRHEIATLREEQREVEEDGEREHIILLVVCASLVPGEEGHTRQGDRAKR